MPPSSSASEADAGRESGEVGAAGDTPAAEARVNRRESPALLLWLGAAALGVILAVRGGTTLVSLLTAHDVPQVDLAGADPMVAEAINAARRAVEDKPGSAETWGRLGKVFRAHEFFPESSICLREAERLDRSDPRWPYLLGHNLRGSHPEEAIACFRRAAAIPHAASSVELTLAEHLFDVGDTDEAESLVRQAIKKDPNSARAHLALGRVLLSRNQVEESLVHLHKSAELAPKVKAARVLMAQAYTRLGDVQAAAKEQQRTQGLSDASSWRDPYLDEVLAVWVGEKAGLTAALEMWDEGRHWDAIKVYRGLVERYPRSERAHYLLGSRLNFVGSHAEAESLLRRAIEISPRFSRPHFELGLSLYEQGRIDEAIPCYRRAIELQEDYAIAWHNLAVCLASKNETPAAIDAVRKAILYKPDSAKAHRLLATLLRKSGGIAEAKEMEARAAELDDSAAVLEWTGGSSDESAARL